MKIKQIFGKNERKQIEHIIIGFHSNEATYLDALCIAQKCALFIGKRFQVCFAIHKKQSYLHIHFAVNTVSYLDGRRFYDTYGELNSIEKHLQSLFPDFKWHYRYSAPGDLEL